MFEVIIDSSEVGMRKPDPRIFRLALDRLTTVEPERALFLDDFQSNLDAAEALGIQGFLVEEDPTDALSILDTLIARRAPLR